MRPRLLSFQVVRNLGELGESGLEVFDDFRRDYIWVGEICAVFEALVFTRPHITEEK